MSFAEPEYDPEIVDAAGDTLIGYADAQEYLDDLELDPLDIINNWRAAHAYPLNTFQMTLRNRARQVDHQNIVAQRIKRLSSIEDKLRRYDWLKLSAMQDIAGCIVNTVSQVYELVEGYKRKYSGHVLDSESDYIREPKSDGYRSYHLIYRYQNALHPAYSNLKVEMQFRSILQHCWATAVETADIFYREGLKSHRGSPDWRRFFALMGSAIALRENYRRVPRTPRGEGELLTELRDYAERLDVRTRLKAFGDTLNVIGEEETRRARIKYVILVLDPPSGNRNISLYGYRAGDLEEATARYEELERHKAQGADAVLVSVSDAVSLRRAYPNYFLDTTVFLEALDQAIS